MTTAWFHGDFHRFLTEGVLEIRRRKTKANLVQIVDARNAPEFCFFCEDLFVEPGPYIVEEAPASVCIESHRVEAYHMGQTKLNAILRSSDKFASDTMNFLANIKEGPHSLLHRSHREQIYQDCLQSKGAFDLPASVGAPTVP
jgi:hypothetical protein